MGRLIIYAAICFVAYAFLKTWFKGSRKGGMAGTRRNPYQKPPPIIDELVQDPVCGVYCPKGEALTLYYDGKTHYFCSRKCLERFRHSRAETGSTYR